MKNTLKSYERLKSLKSIDYIFSKEGKSINEEDLTLRYAFVNISDYPLKAGFSVSKRLYKKAHDRNKYKRYLREAYRTRKAPFIEYLNEKELAIHLFFILKMRVEGKTFQNIDNQVESCLKKLMKKLTT